MIEDRVGEGVGGLEKGAGRWREYLVYLLLGNVSLEWGAGGEVCWGDARPGTRPCEILVSRE